MIKAAMINFFVAVGFKYGHNQTKQEKMNFGSVLTLRVVYIVDVKKLLARRLNGLYILSHIAKINVVGILK